MANLLRKPMQLPARVGALLAAARRNPLATRDFAHHWLRRSLAGVVENAHRSAPGANIFEKLLAELKVSVHISETHVKRIPATGPVVIVANHPFGFLEGAVLASLTLQIRPDVKIMANHLIPPHPLLENFFLFVDPYQTRQATLANRRPLQQAIEWLRQGRAMIVFPSGDVSYPDLSRRSVADPEWNPSVARLIRLGQAAALPAFVSGSNSATFHLLGLLHPRLRTLRLPAELLNKRNYRLEARLGRPLPPSQLAAMTDFEMINHLRARTYVLSRPPRNKPASHPPASAPAVLTVSQESIASRIESLPARHLLVESKDWQVLCLDASSHPDLLQEIGRLREQTFRAAGEGSGNDMDLDRFDFHYDQLMLWSRKNREIAGGYRLVRSAEVLARRGIDGLYTSTLFQYKPDFFARIGPAIELGRSFVTVPYQKQFTPLLALWQGIGAYVRRHPQCRVLFGAVSVSADYQPLSRQILASTLLDSMADPALAPFVAPRHRLRHRSFPGVGQDWKRLVIRDVEELSELIADLEPDGKGIPVLLRQYLRLGGRLLAFTVDRHFSNTLDGLVVVDLLRTELSLLERYMTKEGAAEFLRFHNALPPSPASPTTVAGATQPA